MSGCCDNTPSTGKAKVGPVEFCTLNHRLVYEDGRLVKIPRPTPVADGIYTNATITVQAGCIVAVQSGQQVVYQACDPCAGQVPPPPTPSITLDGNACNILSQSGNGLLAQIVTGDTNCIELSGCGTAGSPLVALPIISPDAGNALECRPNGLFAPSPSATTGVNFTGCGIQITNGLVTALPLPFTPVLELYNDDGTVIITPDGGNPCRVRLRATPDPTPPDISIACGAGLVNAPGDLTDPPNGPCFSAVGASNPRDFYAYFIGIGWRQLLGVTVNI